MKRPIRHPRAASAQSGLGLIEIMVALAISAVLLTGVIQIFLSSKLSYRISEANARVQEGGRFAMEFLNNDLRMAGHLGCFRGGFSAVENVLTDPAEFGWNLEVPLEGSEWTGTGWSPALPEPVAGEALSGSDVLTMRGVAGDSVPLIEPFSDGAQLFANAGVNNLEPGDIVMITACNRGAIAQITSVDVVGADASLTHDASGFVPGNAASNISSTFGAGAEVGRVETKVYYVGTGASGEPALFRSSLTNIGGTPQMQTQELIEGAESLQIAYGEDTDGDGVANRYVNADEADMLNVVSVRLSLLLRTEDNIASTPQTYLFDGEEFTAEDLRMRRVFTSTVKLRNRGLL